MPPKMYFEGQPLTIDYPKFQDKLTFSIPQPIDYDKQVKNGWSKPCECRRCKLGV